VFPPVIAAAHTDSTAAVLGALAAAAFAAGAVSLVWVNVMRTGHRPAVDAVSDYGASTYRAFYTATVVSLGLGALLLLAGLARGTDVPRGGLIWLGVYGVSRIAIAFFPTDLEGQPVTPMGRVHLVLAAAAFTAIAFAAADLSTALGDEPGWHGAASLLDALRWAVIVTAVATLVTRVAVQLRRVAFGLVERLLYAASIAWLLVVAVELAIVAG
jgi:hypothetical protein